jgi:hypothetical protein
VHHAGSLRSRIQWHDARAMPPSGPEGGLFLESEEWEEESDDEEWEDSVRS